MKLGGCFASIKLKVTSNISVINNTRAMFNIYVIKKATLDL
jgi:hypothetical protein